jgi:hypothetical protein
MPGKMRLIHAISVVTAALLSLTPAAAQQAQPQQLPSAQGRPSAKAPAASPRPADKAEPSQGRSGEAHLRQRIEQLEEQLVDM